MNSLLRFFPIGNYTGLRTNPVMNGIVNISYNYDNNKNINGILIRASGYRFNEHRADNSPVDGMVRYFADGTFISYHHGLIEKRGTWTIVDNSLILIHNYPPNPRIKPKKSIVNRTGNIITIPTFRINGDDYKFLSIEVLTGIDKTETIETMVSNNSKNNKNILFQNILAIIIVLILIFYFVYLSK